MFNRSSTWVSASQLLDPDFLHHYCTHFVYGASRIHTPPGGDIQPPTHHPNSCAPSQASSQSCLVSTTTCHSCSPPVYQEAGGANYCCFCLVNSSSVGQEGVRFIVSRRCNRSSLHPDRETCMYYPMKQYPAASKSAASQVGCVTCAVQ